MTLEEARAMLRRLLDGYPNLNLAEPERYIADLCSLLVLYPNWAGEQAVSHIKRTTEWPPAYGALRKELEDRVRTHRYAAEWEAQTRRQLADKRTEQRTPEYSARVVDRIKNELRAKGFRFKDDKQIDNALTVSAVKQKFGITDEQWEALPSAPYDEASIQPDSSVFAVDNSDSRV
jgi:hypothetical protein